MPYDSERVCDKFRIEINRRHLLNGLSDNSGSEPVATTDLKHMRETVEHLRNEFVARHHERKPLGIVEIGPARHEAHPVIAGAALPRCTARVKCIQIAKAS